MAKVYIINKGVIRSVNLELKQESEASVSTPQPDTSSRLELCEIYRKFNLNNFGVSNQQGFRGQPTRPPFFPENLLIVTGDYKKQHLIFEPYDQQC